MREDLEEEKILAKLYFIIALTAIFDLLTASLISLALNSKRIISVNLLYFKIFCLVKIDSANPIGSFFLITEYNAFHHKK